MILLDVGAFNGDSVLHFMETEANVDKILAFDPNNTFWGIWNAISERYPKVKFYEAAVYNRNGTVKYTQRPTDKPFGSTIAKNKRDWGQGDVREVKCLDIAELVTEDCVLKLDAEGSEYEILERLIETNKLKFIKRLYLEWHTTKMTTDYTQRQSEIEAYLKKAGVEVREW